MAFQYDINKIFAELEQQARIKSKKHEKVDLTKENDPIESPEDIPQTQEVAPATSKTSEDTHGGDEATKEIKDSPNSADDGENPDKENKSKKTKNTGEDGKGDGSGTEDKQTSSEEKKESDDKKSKEEQDEDYFITTDGKNPSKNEPKTSPKDLQQIVEKLFEEKKKKEDDFKSQNKQAYLKKYIFEIIKKIAAQHAGIDKQDGSETYDKKQMLRHMLKYQN